MTKKLFLAAASVAALAFAGAANAGDISGYFAASAGTPGATPAAANDKFAGAVTGTPASSYLMVSELKVSSATPNSGWMHTQVELDTPIVVGSGSASRDYLVAFTIGGAVVKSTGLALNVKDASGWAAANAATLVSNQNGVVTYLVSVSAGDTAEAFELVANVEQSAQAPITVSSTVTAVIGGTNVLVDDSSAIVAAKYQSFFAPLSVKAETLEAKLAVSPATDDYVLVGSVGNPGATSGTLATDFKVSGANVIGEYNADLKGADFALTALDGGTLTVKGPRISDAIKVSFGLGTAVTTPAPAANTAVFSLDPAQSQAFAAGTTDLTITNAAGDEEFAAGDYTVTWAPKTTSTYTAPAASTVAAGTIVLEGTNFTAPWVSGTGLADSVIRVSNSNGADSAPVTVRMISGTKVVNGQPQTFTSTAAPLVLGSVPAGGDLQIRSDQLVTHFGQFTRGDFRITINQDQTGLVAKMRSTRKDSNQTFEQSLAAN
ncbi:hypothetical protein [Brevundimonas diminuta]|uniref:hypothetical protein n=1 Tax=Brevundimonas diminuta TaxID=293 RepID=UPI003D054EF6